MCGRRLWGGEREAEICGERAKNEEKTRLGERAKAREETTHKERPLRGRKEQV